jgi:GNAT superfamily N-acetyltransferase
MRDRAALRPRRSDDPAVRVERIHACSPSFWRYLYSEVGRRHHWVDRLPWTDDQIRDYLADPAVSLWLMSVGGAPAGYFELRKDGDGGIEIAYFGLLEDFIGRGLGGHLLTVAAERAWDLSPSRVWLHTNTLDHPAALRNYQSRGFTIVRTEEFEI